MGPYLREKDWLGRLEDWAWVSACVRVGVKDFWHCLRLLYRVKSTDGLLYGGLPVGGSWHLGLGVGSSCDWPELGVRYRSNPVAVRWVEQPILNFE